MFPDVIPKDDRIALLKMGYSGKDIELIAIDLSGYLLTKVNEFE